MANKIAISSVLLFMLLGTAFATTRVIPPNYETHKQVEEPQYARLYEFDEHYIIWPDSGISISFLTRDTSEAFYDFHWADRVSFQYRTAGADNADNDSLILLLVGEDSWGYQHVLDTIAAGAYADAADDSSTIMVCYGPQYIRGHQWPPSDSVAAPVDSTYGAYGNVVGKQTGYNWWQFRRYYLHYLAIGTKTDDTLYGVIVRYERGLAQ